MEAFDARHWTLYSEGAVSVHDKKASRLLVYFGKSDYGHFGCRAICVSVGPMNRTGMAFAPAAPLYLSGGP